MKKRLLTLLFSAFFLAAFSQDRVVEGTVTDAADKSPVIGATIGIKGAASGTVTDADGKFSLVVPKVYKVLVVSFIGKKTQEVTIPESGTLEIVLVTDALNLDQIVVTALGIKQEKRALSYSVQDVSGDDITKTGTTNIINGIAGKVAGAQVISSSGAPGSSFFIKLRGTNSLTGDNQPLFVVDGLPIDNSMNYSGNPDDVTNNLLESVNYSNRGLDINPDDIESISVLKGPAATALYGIAASNGALIITTKKGKATKGKKVNVSVGTNVTFDQVNRLPELQNTYVQGSGYTVDGDGFYTGYDQNNPVWYGPDFPFSPDFGGYLKQVSFGPNKDSMYWDGDATYAFDKNGRLVGASDPTAMKKFVPYDNAKKFFQTGVTVDNNFAISGGSDIATYRMSFSDLRQKGIFPLSNYARTSVSINADVRINSKLSSSASITYVNSGGDRAQQGSNLSGLMLDLMRTPISFDNSNGTSNPKDETAFMFPDGTQRNYRGGAGYDNPFWTVNKNPFRDNVHRAYGVIQLNYKPITWLDIMYRVGGDFYSDARKQAFDINSRARPVGQIFHDQHNYRHINSDLIVTASGKLAKDLNGSILVGQNIYHQNYQQLYTQGDGMTIPGFFNMSNVQSVLTREYSSKYRTLAVYFDGKLDYKNMLFINVTGRNEWTSTLARGKNSFFYPSASIGFIFTEPAGLSNNKWFPYGKVRFSFAQVGKDAPVYGLQTYYVNASYADGWTTGNSFPINGFSGFTYNDVGGNPDLKAEKTNSYEAGIDLRFFENRLGIDFTFYYSKSTNQILKVPVSPSSGLAEIIKNAGSVRNQGYEITVNANPVNLKGFRWDILLNWSRNENKVLSLAPGVENLFLNGFEDVSIRAFAGQPYGVIYATEWMRDDNGKVIIDDDPSSANYGFPIVDAQSRVLGNINPDWLMGITNTFSYKGLSLSFLIDIKKGGDLWNGTRGALTFFGRSKLSENRNVMEVFDGVAGHVDANGDLVHFDTDGVTEVAGAGSTNSTQALIDENWYTGNGGGFGSASGQFVEDGSYVRFRELSLSYSLDSKWLEKSPVKAVSISFITRNLGLFTKYHGVDPETSLTGATNAQGIDYFNNPGTKSYGFSVRLGF